MRDSQFDQRIVAAVEMVGRCGASEFEVGYLVDDPPPGASNWYASAKFRKGTLTTMPMADPVEAAEALADMLRDGATCAWCGRKIAWGERRNGRYCWWRKIGGRWEKGCPKRDEPMVKERP